MSKSKARKGILFWGTVIVLLFAAGGVQAGPSPNPVPYITTLSPISVVPGGESFTLTVNGFNFVSNSTVYWGQTALATTYVSSGKLTATVTSTLIASGGSGWITVQSPTPGGGISNLVFLPVANSTTSLTLATFTYSTGGSTPYSLAQGDFNGDGKLDIVASNCGSNNISVLLGNGDGTFQAAVNYPTGSCPWGIAVGDANGDGKLDLVVGQEFDGSNAFYLLLGNGDGTFQAAQGVGASNNDLGNFNPLLLDVNGDGNLDVLMPEYWNGTVAVYLGNGDGTFQDRQQALGSGSYYDFTLAVGDYNGDGKMDFAIGSYDGSTSIALGNGDGTFQPPQSMDAPGSCWITVPGDFNNDDKLDFACGDSDDTTVGVFLGNGDGTFQTYSSIDAGTGNYAIATGDLNADGKLDILSGESGSGLSVLLGNGDGTFQPANSFAAGTGYSYRILAGSFATGGGLGIATVDGNGNVIVLLQTVSLSPSTFDFGSQGQSVASTPQTFTLTNSTSNTVAISGITFTGDNAADFSQTSDCPANLDSGASCTIQVTFTPGGTGVRSATLTVNDNAPGNPQISALTGTGVISAIASLSSTTVSFGNQPVGTTSAAQTVTLTNTGTGPLVISSITATGANASDYHESDDCGGTVAPSASCTISVTFTASASGSSSASLVLTDNAADSPQSITLSGTGARAAATLSANSLTFSGTMVSATSATQTVTLTNSGNAPLTVSSISASGADAADFTVTNNCGASLESSASCTISVAFKPAAGGTRTATITVTDSATPSTQTISLSATGEDFAMSASSAQTVAPGQTASFQLQLTPQGGFNQSVTFACSNAPVLTTCSVSPTSVTLNGSPSNISVMVTTTGKAFAPPSGPTRQFPIWPMTLLCAATAFGLFLLSSRIPQTRFRPLPGMVAAGILLLASIGMMACNGSGSPKTAAGTYELTVTATSGNLQHTATVQVTVARN